MDDDEEYTFPCCPYEECPCHYLGPDEPYTEFQDWGSYDTKAFGEVPRFRCLVCGHTFSTQTFRVDYYAKRVIDYSDLLLRLAGTSSLSAIGRAISASTDTVSNRIARASRQALAFESRLSCTRSPSEDLAADGFESFLCQHLNTTKRKGAYFVLKPPYNGDMVSTHYKVARRSKVIRDSGLFTRYPYLADSLVIIASRPRYALYDRANKRYFFLSVYAPEVYRVYGRLDADKPIAQDKLEGILSIY